MKSYFLILVLLTSITFAQNKGISKLPTDISLTSLQGKSVSLKTLKDGKSQIVLDFWATWSHPVL